LHLGKKLKIVTKTVNGKNKKKTLRSLGVHESSQIKSNLLKQRASWPLTAQNQDGIKALKQFYKPTKLNTSLVQKIQIQIQKSARCLVIW